MLSITQYTYGPLLNQWKFPDRLNSKKGRQEPALPTVNITAPQVPLILQMQKHTTIGRLQILVLYLRWYGTVGKLQESLSSSDLPPDWIAHVCTSHWVGGDGVLYWSPGLTWTALQKGRFPWL